MCAGITWIPPFMCWLDTLKCDPRLGGAKDIPTLSQIVSISLTVQSPFGLSLILARSFGIGTRLVAGAGAVDDWDFGSLVRGGIA